MIIMIVIIIIVIVVVVVVIVVNRGNTHARFSPRLRPGRSSAPWGRRSRTPRPS